MKPGRIITFLATLILLVGAFFILRALLSPTPSTNDLDRPRTIRIDIKSGKPVDGVQNIQVTKGQRIHLEVTSDSIDTLHLHGYDKSLDLQPSGQQSTDFTADIAGTFEAELHGSDNQVLILVVQPK